jgi:hypothetical protein
LAEVKLLDKVRTELRTKHYSNKTEKAYLSWIKRFILFHNKRHSKSMGAEEIKVFINNLFTNHTVQSSVCKTESSKEYIYADYRFKILLI